MVKPSFGFAVGILGVLVAGLGDPPSQVRNQPTLADAARASPEALKEMLLRSFASDTEIFYAGLAPQLPSNHLVADVTLRRAPRIGNSGTGICTVEEIELSSSAAGFASSDMPLPPPTLSMRVLYRLVGPITFETTIAATEPTDRACARLDRKSQFFWVQDYTGSSNDLAPIAGLLFQETQRRLGDADLPFLGDSCGEQSACVALVRGFDAGSIASIQRHTCYVDGDARPDPACFEYQIEIPDTTASNGQAGFTHKITLDVTQTDWGEKPLLKRVRYSHPMWMV